MMKTSNNLALDLIRHIPEGGTDTGSLREAGARSDKYDDYKICLNELKSYMSSPSNHIKAYRSDFAFPYSKPLKFPVVYSPPMKGVEHYFGGVQNSHVFRYPVFGKNISEGLLFFMTTRVASDSFVDDLLEVLNGHKWSTESNSSMGAHIKRALTENPLFQPNRSYPYLDGAVKGAVRMVSIDLDGNIYYLPEGKYPIFREERGDDCFPEGVNGTVDKFGAGLSMKYFQKGKLIKVLRKVFETTQGFHKIYFKDSCNLIKQALEDLDHPSFSEELTNAFMSHYKALGGIEIVSGEDIRTYYGSRYTDRDYNLGTLATSCMRHPYKEGEEVELEIGEEDTAVWAALEFYVRNPEVVKLVTLRNFENGKVRGRALLWEATAINWENKRVQFLDRIYGNDLVRAVIKKYALSNGWICKSRQNSHVNFTAALPEEYSHLDPNVELTCSAKVFTDIMPYMDTMGLSDGHSLGNTTFSGHQDLQIVPYEQGEFDRGIYVKSRDDFYPDDEVVYSEYSDRMEHVEDVIWSDYLSDYIPCDEAVHPEDTESWYPYDSLEIGVCHHTGDYYTRESLFECEYTEKLYYIDHIICIVIDDEEYSIYYKMVEDFVSQHGAYPVEGAAYVYTTEEPVEN